VLRSRVTYAHKSLILNEHWTAATPPVQDSAHLFDTTIIDRVVLRPQYRDTLEALHLAQGGTANRVHKGILLLQMAGRILTPAATQVSSLADREMALRLALDPYECYRDSTSTEGVHALDWQEPTADTTNYATGWIALRRYARPMMQPETTWAAIDSGVRQWTCAFACPDPRLYEQTVVQVTEDAAGPGSLINKGNIPAPLRVTITMAGAGDTNFTITRGGVAFILNLSGLVNGDVIVATMETCGPFGTGKKVTKNGADAFSRKTSAATTWLDVPVGTTSFTQANTTNITSVLYEFYHARA
jgi:hypothetical protein